MARRSPPHGLKSRLRVEPLEDRCVPAVYAAAPLAPDFPGLAAGLTPDGFYNSPEGIRRLGVADAVIPQADYLPFGIQLVRSFGENVFFAVDGGVLYKTVGTPAPPESFDGGAGVRLSDLTFVPGAPGALPAVYYRRSFTTTLGVTATSDEGLWRAVPDGNGGLVNDGKLAGGGLSAYEQDRDITFTGIAHPTVFGGSVFFAAVYTDTLDNAGTGLFSVGPGRVVVGHGDYPPGSTVRGLYPTSVGLLAVVNTPTGGDELFAGAALLRDINPGPGHAYPAALHDAGGTVYFLADDGTRGAEPWATDGTPGGTRLLKDVNPGPADGGPTATSRMFAGAGDRVYFAVRGVAGGTPTGLELWRTDGTEAGTRLVSDTHPGAGDGVLPTLFADGDGVLFAATTGQVVGGRVQFNLWQSDGTAAGTRLVRDFAPEGQHSPQSFFRFGSDVHFVTVTGGGFFGVPVPWEVTRDPNRPPVLAVPPGDRHAPPGLPFTFALPADTFADADLDTLTLTAARDDGTALPAWLTFDPGTRAFAGTPAAPGDVGEVRLKVVARDAAGLAATARFVVYVDDLTNHAPTLRTAPPDVSTRIGFQVVAQLPPGTFADADLPAGDSLTFALARTDGQPLPTWLNFSGDTVFATPPLGSYPASTVIPLRVTATDAAGATAAADFAFTVEVVARPAPATVYVDRSFFSPTPADPDGDGPATEYLYDAFADLQQALDAVAAGGTVVVRPGFYSAPRGGSEGPGGGGISTRGKLVTIAPGSGRDGADAAEIVLGSQLTLDPNTTLRLSIATAAPDGAPAAGADHDAITTSGAPVALNGATLALAGGYSYRPGDAFVLLGSAAGEFGAVATDVLTLGAGAPVVGYAAGGVGLSFAPPAEVIVGPSGVPAGRVGEAYAQTLTATPTTGPTSFALTAGALPAGLTLSPTGLLSGTPDEAGSFAFTVTAGSAAEVGTRAYTLDIAAPVPVTIGVSLVGGGTAAATDTPTFVVTLNTTAALTFHLSMPSPGGPRVVDTVLPGVGGAGANEFPQPWSLAPGAYRLVVTAVGTPPVQAVLDFTVLAALQVSPTDLPPGTVGAGFSQSLAATGGTGAATFVVSAGSLPDGVALAPDGTLSGTPASAGAFDFTVTATADGARPGSRTYTLAVAPAPVTLTIAPVALPTLLTGLEYDLELTAAGAAGRVTFRVTAGSMPPGFGLSPDGQFAGSTLVPGRFDFTVTATGAPHETGSRTFTVFIGQSLTLAPHALFDALVGRGYAQTLTATPADAGPFTFTVTYGALPAGLALAPDGRITGTPTVTGVFTFTITAANAETHAAGSRAYTLAVARPDRLSIVPDDLPLGRVGVPYDQTLVAVGAAGDHVFGTNDGFMYRDTLRLSVAADGRITGTPLVSGQYAFRVGLRDATGVATKNYVVTILPAEVGAPRLFPDALPAATLGEGYQERLVVADADTDGPFVFEITRGSLPAGLALAPSGFITGRIESGTTSGDLSNPRGYTFTVSASDGRAAVAREYTIYTRFDLVGATHQPIVPPGEGRLAPRAPISRVVGRPYPDRGWDLVVRDSEGTTRFTIAAFQGTFVGNVNVAVGDLTGDGVDDIAVGAGAGGAPRLEVYDGVTGDRISNGFVFDSRLTGGVKVEIAGGQLVVTPGGTGVAPHVRVFRGGTEVASFYSFAERFLGGVNMSAGDVTGDGVADVVFGAGTGGGPAVLVFDGSTGNFRATYFAGPEDDRGGVRVAVADPDGDGANVVIARAAGTTRAFEPLTGLDITRRFDGIDLDAVFA